MPVCLGTSGFFSRNADLVYIESKDPPRPVWCISDGLRRIILPNALGIIIWPIEGIHINQPHPDQLCHKHSSTKCGLNNNFYHPPNHHQYIGGKHTMPKWVVYGIAGWWFGCHFWHFPIYKGNFIIPIDELIFFRGVAQPPTSYCFNHITSFTSRLVAPVASRSLCPTGSKPLREDFGGGEVEKWKQNILGAGSKNLGYIYICIY